MNNNKLEDNFIEEKEYSLVEFYYIFKKHIKIIFTCIFVITFLTIYYTLIQKPIYSSTGTIMVSDEQQSMSMLDIGMNKNRNFLENEIKILGSRSTSERVVEMLLNTNHKNNLYLFGTREYSPVYYRKYFFSRNNDSQQRYYTNSYSRAW